MTDKITSSGSHRYGKTTLNDSSSAILGDQYQIEYGDTIYNIANAHFTQVPSGELTHINDRFDQLPRPELSLQKRDSRSNDPLSSLIERISEYNAEVAHWTRSSLIINGTCRWLFQNVCYKEWDCTESGVFACTGPVGSGKSILAAALIEHLKQTKASANGIIAHYYLDANTAELSTAQDIFCALLKQFLVRLKESRDGVPAEILPKIQESMSALRSAFGINQLTELMMSAISNLAGSVLIIDGFDGLPEVQLQVLFGMLRKMAQVLKHANCKVAFFGREVLGRGIEMGRQLPNCIHLQLNYSALKHDIERFISVQMADLSAQRKVTENSQLLFRVEEKLKQRGKEMFLWIHLQLLNIWNPRLSKCDADIEDLLENLPSSLADTYKWCLRRIESNEDGEIARKAFEWVSQAKTPLTSQQLRELVSFPSDGQLPTKSTTLNVCVTQYCANLLVIDAMGCVCFTHSSVLQLLSSSDTLGDQYSNYRLFPRDRDFCALVCLQYLSALQSRQKVVVRQQLEIPANYGIDMIRETIRASKWLKIPAAFHKKSRSTSTAVPLYIPRTTPITTLSIHSYILRYWLEHTKEIHGHECKAMFDQVYRSSASDLWPDMPQNLTQADQKSYLVRLAVYLNHVPLLESVSQGFKSTSYPAWLIFLEKAFAESHSSLLHVAATLGHNDVLEYYTDKISISPATDLTTFDSSGRTPLAWAAESGQMHTILWIADQVSFSSLHGCQIFGSDGFLCLWAILAALPSSKCFFELNERFPLESLYSYLLSSLAQTVFAATLTGHTDIVRSMQDVDLLHLELFCYPRIDFQLAGSLVELAVSMNKPGLLKTTMDLLDLNTGLNELARIASKERLPWKLVVNLFECDRYTLSLLFEPAIRRNTEIKPIDAICEVLQRGLSNVPDQIFVVMCLMDEAPERRRFRVILRDALKMVTSTQINLGYNSEVFSKNVRDINELPTDIICKIFSSPRFRAIGQEWFKPQPKNLLLERSTLHYCASLAMTPVEGVSPSDIRKLRLSPSYYVYYAAVPHDPQGFGLRMPFSLRGPGFIWDPSRLKDSAVYRHMQILDLHHGDLNFECRLAILRLWRLVYTVIASPPIYMRWRHQSIVEKFESLYDAGSDGIFDLNFPCGYFERFLDEWQIHQSIVCAIYRWNYRIRRRKGLPYSKADLFYDHLPGIAVKSTRKDLLFRERISRSPFEITEDCASCGLSNHLALLARLCFSCRVKQYFGRSPEDGEVTNDDT